MTYSQYPYVEAFMDEKQPSWIAAHVHMYEYFGGVAKILVPDNCRTAVDHNKGWKDQRINAVYQEMAEHYGTAIIPARVRTPRDKATAEGSVGNISTWITAALRNEQFFSLSELNRAIRQKLEVFSHRSFQKKEGNRYEIFRDEELPLLAPLPATPYELAEWNKPPFSSIITYPLPECYTQFHTNISNAKLMFELQIRLLRFFTTIIGLHPTVVFTDARDNTVQSQSTCHLHTSSTLNGMVIDSANGQNGLVPVLIR